jgi:hypothetical protein
MAVVTSARANSPASPSTDWDDAAYYPAVESTTQNQLDQFVDTATTEVPSLQNVRRDWEGTETDEGARDLKGSVLVKWKADRPICAVKTTIDS